jgi:AbrB family looped-hinge helix DNA binding protein
MITTTVSSRGQVILPSKLRKENKIFKGTKFVVEMDGNKIILTPINRDYFENLSGSISPKKGKLLKALSQEKDREKRL